MAGQKVGVFDASTEGQPEFDVVCSCGWRSTGWADVEHAKARAQQHADEHTSGEPAQELHDFRLERGIVVDTMAAFDTEGATHVIASDPQPAEAEVGE